jgi:hypothetical protein
MPVEPVGDNYPILRIVIPAVSGPCLDYQFPGNSRVAQLLTTIATAQ